MNVFSKWLNYKSKETCEAEARTIYQISERNGSLYLTYNGAYVCPMELFKQDAIATLKEIRNLYVERNSTEQP